MKQVSVIIPTYNRGHIIERSIRSVLQQTYQPLEIIVVDDGSDDNTEEVIREIADSRIVYHKLPENKGVSYARNKGVELANGEWIAFQDSDDCWRENKLEEQMAYAEMYPEYELIYCAYCCNLANKDAVEIPGKTGAKLQGDIFADLLYKNTIGAPTILMRKSAFLKTQGFDSSLRSLEDWEFVIRYAKKNEIGYVDKVLVDAYMSDGGVSSGKGAYFESRCRLIARYYHDLVTTQRLEAVISDLLGRAEANGVLEPVKNMLLLSLQQTKSKM